MALSGLYCADVPLRNYSLTHFTIFIISTADADYKLFCQLI